MLVLSGVAVIIVGFGLGVNPLLVVTLAALVSGLAAGQGVGAIVAALGHAFVHDNFVAVGWLVLPVIGLLESRGLRERLRRLVRRRGRPRAGRLLVAYLAARQATAAIGLNAIGGQAQSVRPVLAPMVEAAGESRGVLSERARLRLRAWAAATDNIGLFFGEDVFLAMGAVLLMRGVLADAGVVVDPWRLSLWAIPTAVFAFVVHAARLLRLDVSAS